MIFDSRLVEVFCITSQKYFYLWPFGLLSRTKYRYHDAWEWIKTKDIVRKVQLARLLSVIVSRLPWVHWAHSSLFWNSECVAPYITSAVAHYSLKFFCTILCGFTFTRQCKWYWWTIWLTPYPVMGKLMKVIENKLFLPKNTRLFQDFTFCKWYLSKCTDSSHTSGFTNPSGIKWTVLTMVKICHLLCGCQDQTIFKQNLSFESFRSIFCIEYADCSLREENDQQNVHACGTMLAFTCILFNE